MDLVCIFQCGQSNNDLNVLYSSPLFNDPLNGVAPVIEFTVNGNPYHMVYYLANGIFPRWPTFVKTLNMPQDPKQVLYVQRQEAARKVVEKLLGSFKPDSTL